jgi:Pectate lyase superfamily protein
LPWAEKVFNFAAPMPPLKIAVFSLALALASAAPAATSTLWGTNGESWQADGRLPDFSFAGYHRGEAPLPDVATGVSVMDFGARGDGVTDDTSAFRTALARANGAVEVPPGRYVIKNILEIQHSGIVLRGAGPDKTTLFFPKPLHAIRPSWSKTTTGRRTSEYSWAGGFVWFRGRANAQVLADVVADARRGDTELELSKTKNLRTGQQIEIFEKDNRDNSLAVELYSGDAGNITNLLGSTHASIVCRITRIETNRIYFDRPLRFAVERQWHPQIRRFEPTVTGSGVENLCLEFPDVPYPGHFNESGYNGIAFSDVADCWARHVVISNADSGIFAGGRFCTITDVTIDCGRAADTNSRCTGHHGVDFTGEDNLFTGFDYRTRFIHDISVEHCAAGNVIAGGRGVDLCLDHHVCAPYENLFVDLDAGAGTRLWSCGGGSALGKHSGARETFWNIRAASPQKLPPEDFGPPSMNFIALQTDLPSETDSTNRWLESIPPNEIAPADLHAAQLAARLRGR